MRSYIFDIEGDSLNPTKIHCLAYCREGEEEVKTITDYEKMRKFLLQARRLIGHNIISFDIPVLEKLLDIKIKAELYDTLPMSWYLEPDRHRHGLESWGEELGVKKPKVDDWENQSIEVYLNRCREDVEINKRLYNRFKEHLNLLYGDDDSRIWKYLGFKYDCIALQRRNGWKLDIEKAKKLYEELSELVESKNEALKKVMPKVPVIAIRSKPNAPYKKDGTLSVAGAKWFNLLKEQNLSQNFEGQVKEIISYSDPNPGSPIQIKDWLYSLGWEPCTYRIERDKVTGDIKKIPQIYEEFTKELSPSILKMAEKYPEIEILKNLSVLRHRLALIEGFLKNVDENGRLEASAHGFTNTLRLKHTIIVNVPGVNKEYGEDIRGCLIADDGYVLCGSDMSSLEDRTKQHYMYEYDPEYVREMDKPDFDPHLDLAVMAGMLTKEQAEAHKQGKENYSEIRHNAKQGNYACTYGAGAPRIAMTANIPLKAAEKIVEGYWKRNWSIKTISENCETKKVKGKSWLYNPVSRFWYSLRNEKDKFSTLNQGTGDYCFTTWLMFVRKHTNLLLGQFHDEIILLVKEGEEEKWKKILEDSIEKVNNKLKLNKKLEIDVKFGKRYSEIH